MDWDGFSHAKNRFPGKNLILHSREIFIFLLPSFQEKKFMDIFSSIFHGDVFFDGQNFGFFHGEGFGFQGGKNTSCLPDKIENFSQS